MSADRFQNPWTMVPGWLSTRSDLDKDQLIIASEGFAEGTKVLS